MWLKITLHNYSCENILVIILIFGPHLSKLPLLILQKHPDSRKDNLFAEKSENVLYIGLRHCRYSNCATFLPQNDGAFMSMIGGISIFGINTLC